MRIRSVVLAGMAVVGLAAPAQAATRYAAPNGTGSAPCTNQAAPCTLPGASTATAPGDTVMLASGNYQLSQTVHFQNVHVLGARTRLFPRPRILAPANNTAVLLTGGSIRNVQVEGTSGTNWVFDASDAVIESTVVLASGSQNDGMVLRGNTRVGDSIASATGNSAAGVLAVDGAFYLRNVTAYSASSNAIVIRANTKATQGSLVNTIAMGAIDIAAIGASAGTTADVTVHYSNYDTSSEQFGSFISSANQASAPALKNPGGADFHELAASPTVNAGSAAVAYLSEADGDPDADRRTVGSAPDIGADEWTPPPSVVTGDTTLIGSTVATVNGTVNPQGGATAWYFQWGPTAAYGNPSGLGLLFAGTDAGNGLDPVTVSRKLTGLQPSTTYHYRLNASNAGGSVSGSDATFTTGPPGTPDPGGSGPVPGQPGGAILTLTKVSVNPARFRVAKRRTAVAAARRKRRPVPRGTAFRYTLSEPAAVRIAIKRKVAGRRKGKTCRRPTRALRRAKRCTRLVARGTLTRASKPGVNSVSFTGRIGKRTLAAGKYLAVLGARDAAGNRSPARSVGFVIVGG